MTRDRESVWVRVVEHWIDSPRGIVWPGVWLRLKPSEYRAWRGLEYCERVLVERECQGRAYLHAVMPGGDLVELAERVEIHEEPDGPTFTQVRKLKPCRCRKRNRKDSVYAE